MNIVTPFPTALVLNTSNVNTEAARRDNVLRETIPQSANSDKGEPERGLGSEGDRARQATGQFSSPLVYERPNVQSGNANPQASGDPGQRDNGSDESAGREDAQQQQQEQAEQAEVRDLKARDREVRAHEQAHAAVGGQYAGSPQYEFEVGPDGQRYAVGGQVSIDISEGRTPEETLRKMQQVRAAALAPASPSPQDFRVAAEASRKALEAQSELVDETVASTSTVADTEDEANATAIEIPNLDDMVAQGRISTPTRTLDNVFLDEGDPENESTPVSQRNLVIERFYDQAVTPPPAGFSATA